MRRIAPATHLVDVHFQGHAEYIGCYVLDTGDALALIDPGPASALPALEAGLAAEGLSTDAVTDVLLTHIHLDHAGATGTLVARHPDLRVHVHRRGARHLVDPSRLMASAGRLYGERMDELWGEFLAVPESAIAPLDGGESLRIGNRCLRVAYTPGHAVHHVSYFDESTGIAWVGDVAGIRIDGAPYVMPVTPPPDVDVDAWEASAARLRDWGPVIFCPTHFGPASPADEHLEEHMTRLRHWSERVHGDLDAAGNDDERASRFAADVRADLHASLGGSAAAGYLAGGGMRDSWHGLARYHRKRTERQESAS